MKKILFVLTLILSVNALYAEDVLLVTKTDGKQYVYPKANVDSLVSTAEMQYVHLSFPVDEISSVKYTTSEDLPQGQIPDSVARTNPFLGHFYATSVSPESNSNLPQFSVMYFVTENVVFISTIIGELTCTMKFGSALAYEYSLKDGVLLIEGENEYDYADDASCFYTKNQQMMYTVYMKVR